MSEITTYRGLVFGAIGVLAETSEIQRQAYNLAFRQAGLDWEWDRVGYREMLRRPGGMRRIADYAAAKGDLVDAEAVHARKVANFRAGVLREGLTPRPGVIGMLQAAQAARMPVAWVTTTGRQTVELMLEGLSGSLAEADFAFVGDRSMVEAPKPAPDIYRRALEVLGLSADEVLAIEDTPESAEAARGAGLDTFGFPGWAASDRIFPEGVPVVTRLSPDLLMLRERV
ncbi:HAD-IA family hydrolase [Rhodobacterales bacterium HKCCSP123]|nr:HAD-IA family hydrolase [Rhodobacterales bacterium HKCCSP123]